MSQPYVDEGYSWPRVVPQSGTVGGRKVSRHAPFPCARKTGKGLRCDKSASASSNMSDWFRDW